MKQILLSINPQHIEKILSGEKKYEFRRNRCKSEINKIIIYATSPVQKIIGEVEVLSIIEDDVTKVWEKTKRSSGITKDFFNKYFTDRKKAIAYELGKVERYKNPKELLEFGLDFAPQSFVYI